MLKYVVICNNEVVGQSTCIECANSLVKTFKDMDAYYKLPDKEYKIYKLEEVKEDAKS